MEIEVIAGAYGCTVDGIEYLVNMDEFDPVEGRKRRRRRRAKRKERRRKRRAEGRGFFRKLGKGIAKVAKEGWKGLKKFNPVLVLGRNSFRTLVALNFQAFGTKLSKVDQKKLRKTWERLGGKWSHLQQAIKKGKRKGIKKGVNGIMYVAPPIPLEEPAMATVLASAAPIIAALSKLFKDLKEKGVKIDIPGSEKIEKLVNKAKELDPGLFDLVKDQIFDTDQDSEEQFDRMDIFRSGIPDETAAGAMVKLPPPDQLTKNTGKTPATQGAGILLPLAALAFIFTQKK